MTDMERQAHVEALKKAKQERLDALELRAATMGYGTPAEIVTEMEQLRADLAALEPVSAPMVSDDVRKLLRRYDAMEYMQNVMAGLAQRVTLIEQSTTTDKGERQKRQRALDIWLGLLTLAVLLTLFLVARG